MIDLSHRVELADVRQPSSSSRVLTQLVAIVTATHCALSKLTCSPAAMKKFYGTLVARLVQPRLAVAGRSGGLRQVQSTSPMLRCGTVGLVFFAIAQIAIAADSPKACSSTTSPCALEDTAVEYQQKSTGVHFFTACKEEKLALDTTPALFSKTGRTIPLWTTAAAPDVAVVPAALARYFISVSTSEAARHFQTVLPPEKAVLDSLTTPNGSAYCLERQVSGYAIVPPALASLTIDQLTIPTVQASASCPAGSRPVWRLFNDRTSAQAGKAIAAQHRFTASWAEMRETIALNDSAVVAEAQAANWQDEGVRFCAPGAAQVISLAIDVGSLTPTAQQGAAAAYTLRFQLRNEGPVGTAALTPFVAVQLPAGVLYQSSPVGTTCTADTANAAGQRVVCVGSPLLQGGTATMTFNATAASALATPLSIAATAIGGATQSPSADQLSQLHPQACTAKSRPAFGCDKATATTAADTISQAAAKLNFTGTLQASVAQSGSSPVVSLGGLALSAGSATPVNVNFYVEYSTDTSNWQAIDPQTVNVQWTPSQQVTSFASPQSVSGIKASFTAPSALSQQQTVYLRVCAKAMTAELLWRDNNTCAASAANAGYTATSARSASIAVGTVTSSVPPALTIQGVSTQTVQSGGPLPTIDLQVSRQSNSSPPSGEFSCSATTAPLGYACAPSGTLLGASTVAYCHCTSSQTAPSSGTYTVTVSASAPGATASGQASGSIQVYVPPVTTDYGVLSWSGEQISRDAQTGQITVKANVQNTGSTALDTKFSLLAVGGASIGAAAVSPSGGRVSVGAAATQAVTFTAAASTADGTHLYLCAARTNAFGDVLGGCSQANQKTIDASASAELIAPPQSTPYWGVQLREQTGSAASPVDSTDINLTSLTSGQTTASAWLIGCTQLQTGGGTPPACTVSIKLADNTTRALPASPLTLGTDYALYFKGADSNGNLTVCAGAPWAAASGCNAIWQDALAISSVTVAIGSVTKTVTVRRNIPPPPAVLTVVAPASTSVNSGGTLPTLTYSVSRQNPSVAPTGPLSCTVTATAQMPNPLNYSCVANGDITTSTTASCTCSPNPTTAPAVTTTQTYRVEVRATATGATDGAATASVSVQTPAGNRGCTDDTSIPVIKEIDFATTQAYSREGYEFSTVGDGISQPPPVAAIRLRVSANSNWNDGVISWRGASGYSIHEIVTSRCRGRFDAGGREHINYLLDYTGPQNSPVAAFVPWWVDPVTSPDAYTATLRSPGKQASDGWVSDGIYYINIRQVFCGGGAGATCARDSTGSGSNLQH